MIDEKTAWQHLEQKDASARFLYGVSTTGVFCRVGCGSRLPKRENVRIFATTEEAERAGFRPCLRCKPTAAEPARVIAGIARYIEEHRDRSVTLAELGRFAGMSPFQVQKRFTAAMGASPLAYQRALRAERLRQGLKEGGSVTEAIHEAGFGSSSRGYEGAALGMTPARFAQGGRGERIGFTTAETGFGWMIVAATERGLCWLALASSDAAAEATLREEFPEAELRRDAALTEQLTAALAFVSEAGAEAAAALRLDLRGTAFQLRVWQALRRIPQGQTVSYSALARELGAERATRAVARACAQNRVALLVPCHRVVGATGALTGYRWGVERKRQLLAAERSAAKSEIPMENR